uniref:3'(2'),5'-bisphosphate nucleotidase 1 n=1 Tax=Grammatophora oceanica TaxID=210454 RepID=A0A7S1VQY0_9STRA|mmetsp:Transcript_5365/g.7503  ORF Transcript_5365/g.7503 Transcript_5365/m.7503 type:complete len:427 (+) Transcript_5365:731-2011(+)|eukprot:CAMPEP_0194027768 /NCGR_PEP_ID=MMETSP0009_2-20130614/1841_1 /TAXON_ID=210454 /ORGANISM="Grammatophora oceanica, Strain CCMP 410" /LENGTH=426 /DNA_ID=CAMNT_0038666937 /DNA_START=697 /DNA_END=1977 /DNA_ORIENTATION=-
MTDQSHQQEESPSSSSSPSSTTTVNLLDLAAACVASTVAAAHPIREHAADRVLPDAREKYDGSLVTDADYAAQGVIYRCLKEVPGNYRIVGEESPEEMEMHSPPESPEQTLERKRIFKLAQEELLEHYDVQNGRRGVVGKQSAGEIEKKEESDNPVMMNGLDSPTSSGKVYDSHDNDVSPSKASAPSNAHVVDASRVSVFIDPLDGTKSYAKGDYDTVTILVAIILDNVPYFGVITKPFRYKSHDPVVFDGLTGICVYGGLLLGGVYVAGKQGQCEIQPPLLEEQPQEGSTRSLRRALPRAVISSSRSGGIVQEFVHHLADQGIINPSTIHVSGAGEKSLRLLLGVDGESLWFFPRPGTARWDVAASDAMLRVFGGKVTDKYGADLDYTINREEAENKNGIIASNDGTILKACVDAFQQEEWSSQR